MIIDLAYVTDPFIGNGVIKKEGTERCDVTESLSNFFSKRTFLLLLKKKKRKRDYYILLLFFSISSFQR